MSKIFYKKNVEDKFLDSGQNENMVDEVSRY